MDGGIAVLCLEPGMTHMTSSVKALYYNPTLQADLFLGHITAGTVAPN